MSHNTENDHSAAFAIAFLMANLLFVIFGAIFYLALWVLYIKHYKNSPPITQDHIKQALIASTISTAIFVGINIFILATGGYVPLSLPSLLALEFYFMVVVPVFLVIGILAFVKAVRNEEFRYPLIYRLL